MRRDEPLHRSDNDEVIAVMLSVAAGAEYLAYAGIRLSFPVYLPSDDDIVASGPC
jgi:hypothetical protein